MCTVDLECTLKDFCRTVCTVMKMMAYSEVYHQCQAVFFTQTVHGDEAGVGMSSDTAKTTTVSKAKSIPTAVSVPTAESIHCDFTNREGNREGQAIKNFWALTSQIFSGGRSFSTRRVHRESPVDGKGDESRAELLLLLRERKQ